MKNDKYCAHQAEGGVGMQKLCISIVPIFNHLTATEMDEIVNQTHSVTYQRGQTIYSAGDSSDGLYIIHKGRVKIYRLSETGKEQLVRILQPGDFSGELSLFTKSVHDAYAEAMETVEICMMPYDDFQNLLLKYPAIALKMLNEFSLRLGKTEKQAATIAMESAETRIAMYLANQVEEQSTLGITLPMTRKDLASHLGTTPETVSRKLTEFEQAKWITQTDQRNIQILDLDTLLLL